jgi:CO dehydrogenase maturation factor
MRIAFLGKGGSGKTTLSTLFTKHLIANHYPVLSVDADVNVHFGAALGVPLTPLSLSDHYRDIYLHLEGKNPALPPSVCIPECGAIPVTQYSTTVSLSENDSFLQRFAIKHPDLPWWHLAVGTYHDVGDGGDCFHYKTNAYQLVLHHLQDSLDDYLVADTTAGIDNLSTSLSIGYDLCVICVEPTKKSLSVFESFTKLSASLPIPYFVVANKVEDPADLDFIRRHIPSSAPMVEIPFKAELLDQEKSTDRTITLPVDDYARSFALIAEAARQSQQQSRAHRTTLLRDFYKREVESYWNDYHGTDLTVLLNETASHSQQPEQLCA